MTVLVADDSPVARYTLLRELRKQGIEAACVGSAAEALSFERDVTCAILDLDLGDALGTEVAIRLREKRPDVPIAFFTSSCETALAETLGPVFAKPADLAEAVAWVSRTSRERG